VGAFGEEKFWAFLGTLGVGGGRFLRAVGGRERWGYGWGFGVLGGGGFAGGGYRGGGLGVGAG